jgi:DNA-directed RNA polymerase subunit RPC12/RpoP
MYRKCDRCQGIFKIPFKISVYIINNNNKIYCPYCDSPYSHVHITKEKIQSQRGDILY